MVKLFANSGDPDQTPRSAASDLSLHCLPVTLLGVSRLQWANIYIILMIPVILVMCDGKITVVLPDQKLTVFIGWLCSICMIVAIPGFVYYFIVLKDPYVS